ncbi:MAG: CsbD family protein [Gaiellaceae bacterium]
MSTDEAKGRIKEAAGDLTDDKDLKREGKTDQMIGNVKEKVDDAGDKIKDAVSSDGKD